MWAIVKGFEHQSLMDISIIRVNPCISVAKFQFALR